MSVAICREGGKTERRREIGGASRRIPVYRLLALPPSRLFPLSTHSFFGICATETEICSMFTGIIEAQGIVKEVISKGSNKSFWIECPLSSEFKVDQSVSHNGVCLTVEEIKGSQFRVTAIDETLQKTNIGSWSSGTAVNIERSLLLSSRLDGHFVQGHVDTTGICLNREDKGGSWEYEFNFQYQFTPLIIEKGSICVNGISLTAFEVTEDSFKVAIIPYTFDHTNIGDVKPGSSVNLEFDILGKYIQRSFTQE